ncbi:MULTISPECIES: MarR family transcriptional regulator [unclassified Streptomyces]|uniref:MarR family winged helix-turn-helix transcriptional regulator n=1 Tax=unclassified Streptomyces TaxID=2593676 RepID=UPI0029A43D58|nr:MarR family transcriptional regulator [Streptomyces sp. FL07-04A]MDX3579692.1 MarR family transcriptional regulator [Streptomyces sp. FL07-04A]
MAEPAEHPADLPACPSAQGSGGGLLPPELRGWMLLLAATGAVEQRLRSVVKDRLDVSHDEFLVLCLLAEQPGQGLRMTRVAELLGRPKTRLTYQIACLQHAGLVTRQSVCGDRRGVEVALTDKARRLLQEASGTLAETVTAALDQVMGPEQCAALSGLLPDAGAGVEAPGEAHAAAHARADTGAAARAGADPDPTPCD